MNETKKLLTEARQNSSGETFPPNSSFLHHSIEPGDKRTLGFTLFEDYYLTFSQADMLLLQKLWEKVAEREGSYQIYLDSLFNQSLTETESIFIAKAAAVIVALNGSQIGEGLINNEQLKKLMSKRVRAYKDTDLNRTTTLNDIKGEGIVMCAEASVIVQALSPYIDGYHVASAKVVSKADTDQAEGHQINFLISDVGSRVVLVDTAYGTINKHNDTSMLVPYIAIIKDDQIIQFENGQNVIVESNGGQRVYRIGTPHTPPGTWKGHQFRVITKSVKQ